MFAVFIYECQKYCLYQPIMHLTLIFFYTRYLACVCVCVCVLSSVWFNLASLYLRPSLCCNGYRLSASPPCFSPVWPSDICSVHQTHCGAAHPNTASGRCWESSTMQRVQLLWNTSWSMCVCSTCLVLLLWTDPCLKKVAKCLQSRRLSHITA